MPFGEVYGPNLTILQEWSDEEIENAIRYGIHPTGEPLLPPMPYEAYAGMADADMEAIIAYLRSLEPVENEVPAALLVDNLTRADIRSVPDLAELPTDPILGPAEDATPEELGEYLVRNVATCIKCHGSLNEDGTLDVEGPLVAQAIIYTDFGEVDGMPTITQQALSAWSTEDLVNYIGYREGGRVFFMPMHAYRYMTDADLEAIAAFLKSDANAE
ncbi:MAG: cytochrome c [Anaerolineae bacterium]|nr:cytochrome c [Anaerolineae bacterium]